MYAWTSKTISKYQEVQSLYVYLEATMDVVPYKGPTVVSLSLDMKRGESLVKSSDKWSVIASKTLVNSVLQLLHLCFLVYVLYLM